MMTEEQRTAALSGLYIPLMLMVVRGRTAFQSFLKSIDRPFVFHYNRPLPPADQELWGRWAEDVFIPMNTQMAVLLEENDRHIPVGSNLRASKWDFISYHENFRAAHERWRDGKGPYLHSANFPQQFQVDAMRDFMKLTGADPNPTYAQARYALERGL
jgi:hypothetical protein